MGVISLGSDENGSSFPCFYWPSEGSVEISNFRSRDPPFASNEDSFGTVSAVVL